MSSAPRESSGDLGDRGQRAALPRPRSPPLLPQIDKLLAAGAAIEAANEAGVTALHAGDVRARAAGALCGGGAGGPPASPAEPRRVRKPTARARGARATILRVAAGRDQAQLQPR